MPKIKKIKLANTEYDIAVDKDWNQNDAEAVDYIKNRPFYTDDGQRVVQLDTKYIPVDNSTIKVEDGKLTAKLSESTYETVIGGKSSLANVSTDKDTDTYLNFIKDGDIESQHAIKGTNGATVTSDANGNIIIDTAKVEWEQINRSGTEIAKITINGTETAVYAPQPTGSDGNTTYTLKVGGANNANNEQINSNGSVYLKLVDNAGNVVSKYSITGTGGATVTSNASGNITISAPAATGGTADGNTTYEIFAGWVDSYGNQDTRPIVGGSGPYLKLFKKELVDTESSLVSQHQIRGEGGLKIDADSSGNIIFYNPPAAEIAPDLTSADTTKVETLKIYETTREEYESATDIEDTSFYLVPDPPTVTIVPNIDGTGEVVEVETLKIYTTTKEQYESTPVADLEDNSLYLIPDPSAWTIETIEDAGHVNLTVADRTEYYLPNADSLSIAGATNPHYECWICAGSKVTTIQLNGMECVGFDGRDFMYNRKYVEISIKDGKYVLGCVSGS
jgi:hypothetical protein